MDKKNKDLLRQAERQDDTKQAGRIGIFNNQYDNQRAEMRSKAMQQYKVDLDSQVNHRKILRSYGNMTNVEKEMNKDDLNAWKKYDNNQYSLIPGHSVQKAMPEPRQRKYQSPPNISNKALALNEDKLRTQEDRLVSYGILSKVPAAVQRHANNNLSASIEAKAHTNPVINKADIAPILNVRNSQQSYQSQNNRAQMAKSALAGPMPNQQPQ